MDHHRPHGEPSSETAGTGAVALAYHVATDHRVDGSHQGQYAASMEEAIRPRPYKLYTDLDPLPLPPHFAPSRAPALATIAEASGNGVTQTRVPDLEVLARLCFFTDGITKRLRRGGREIDFRAAPCTGALYHVELYLVCGDLPDLPAGVYHYGVHDHALRRLRSGDFRSVLVEASGGEPTIAAAPAVMVTTSVFWRNAWKYAARAYRHAYWDTGTMLPNTLAVAAAADLPAALVLGFADQPVADLLGVDLDREGVIGLVALGRTGEPAPPSPPLPPLDLPTEPYSIREIDYPLIRETHRATLLASGAAAAVWRETVARSAPARPAGAFVALPSVDPAALPDDPIEEVIRRRGSTRRFAREPITLTQLATLLDRSTRGVPSDSLGPDGIPFNDAYLIVNAVEGLPTGSYRYRQDRHALERLRELPEGTTRERAHLLSLEQDLGGDAAVNVYFLADLEPILARYGDRGYRLAQLGAALVAGKQYLAAYALGLGATGLTFYDDAVIDFFAPPAAGTKVMFLMAIGDPARRDGRVR